MISPATIALVKERTDITALVAESVRLVRRGRSLLGLCPFHQEKTPSFHVNPERGVYHCFGCKASGGAVDFVMGTDGLSFPEAVRVLAERAGIEVEDGRTDLERREAIAAKHERDDLYAVNAAASVFYEACLQGPSSPPTAKHARAELARRGVALPDGTNAASAFRLGYAPSGWDGLVTYLRKQGISLVAAERVGLIVPRTGGVGHYDRFRHRLMFPVLDVMGRVVAFSGRVLPEATPSPQVDATPPPKYINSPESPIYTKGEHLFGLFQARQPLRAGADAVLVEGNFDVVGLHSRGITNAVAPLGTAFTPAQAKLLRRFGGSVVILFDGDAAGRKATRASREPSAEAALTVRVGTMPRGVDPDELAREHGADAVREILAAAKGFLEYLVDDALDATVWEKLSTEAQAARVKAVMDVLRAERDPTLLAMYKTYADKVVSRIMVRGAPAMSVEVLERHCKAACKPSGKPKAGDDGAMPKATKAAPAPRGVAALRLIVLGALLDAPTLHDEPDVQEALSAIDGDFAMAIAMVAKHRADLTAMIDAVPEKIRAFVAGRLTKPELTEAEARQVLLDNARVCARHVDRGAVADAAAQEDQAARLRDMFAIMTKNKRKQDAAA